MTTIATAESVQRIRLGRIVVPGQVKCGEHGESGYISGWGKPPDNARRGLMAVGSEGPKLDGSDLVYPQLRAVLPKLKDHAIPLEEGPYADKEGKMADLLADTGLDKAEALDEIIERVIDTRPYVDVDVELAYPRAFDHACKFRLEGNLMIPDELSTAGAILSQPRGFVDETTGASFVLLSHPIEAYTLAISALRRKQLEAYPALAVLPDNQHLPEPLIVLVDLASKVPMVTFTMKREHPPLGAIDILSDEAMLSLLYVQRSIRRMREFISEQMRVFSEKGESLQPGEVDKRLISIADQLFEAHKLWAGSEFIRNAVGYFHMELIDKIEKSTFSGLREKIQQRDVEWARRNPDIAANPEMIPVYAKVAAEGSAERLKGALLTVLSARIAGLEVSLPKVEGEPPQITVAEPAPHGPQEAREPPRESEPGQRLASVHQLRVVRAEPQVEGLQAAVDEEGPRPAEEQPSAAEAPAEQQSPYSSYRSGGGTLSEEQCQRVQAQRHTLRAYAHAETLLPPGTPREEIILAAKLLTALSTELEGRDVEWLKQEVALLRTF